MLHKVEITARPAGAETQALSRCNRKLCRASIEDRDTRINMSEFESIIGRLEKGYAFGGKIKTGPQKGKYKFTVGRTPNVKVFYAN